MELSNIQKAAVFLKIIEPAVAMDVLKKLDAGTVSAVSAEMAKLTTISEADKQAVMSEYSMMATMTGAEPAAATAEPVFEFPAAGDAGGGEDSVDISVDLIKKVGFPQVAEIIKDEHPMVIGIILAAFDPATAALLLDALPQEVQLDALRRIAGGQAALPSVKKHVLQSLKRMLDEKEKNVTAVTGGGSEATAEILSYFATKKSEDLVNALKQQDEKMGADIQEHILTFDNIFLKIEDDKTIQKALRNIDRKDLALALRRVNDATKERIFKNMSAAATEMLQEDMDVMGKQKVASVEESQRKIVGVLKIMAKDGILSFASTQKQEEELV